jgi:chromosome segregation ATPase
MDQATQVTQAALQAPINNLVVLVALFSLVILLLAGFIAWKVAPALINLYKAQSEVNRQNAETAKKLTEIVAQNADAARLAMSSVDNNTSEMSRQTTAIEKQTGIIESQMLDQRNYQTLVSDTMDGVKNQVAENTAGIAELKASIETLSHQITEIVSDKVACAGMVATVTNLKNEIMAILQKEQIRKATGTHPTFNGEGA